MVAAGVDCMDLINIHYNSCNKYFGELGRTWEGSSLTSDGGTSCLYLVGGFFGK